MKKYLKFSGIVACLFALVAFILLMATNGVYYQNGNVQFTYAGTTVLFGATTKTIFGLESHVNGAWTGLVGWILIIVAMVILLAGVILPLLKVKALDPFAGVLNLVAVGCLVAGGILLFFSMNAFCAANEWSTDKCHLGAGWVIAGILSILGGCCAILPAAVDFLGKKK